MADHSAAEKAQNLGQSATIFGLPPMLLKRWYASLRHPNATDSWVWTLRVELSVGCYHMSMSYLDTRHRQTKPRGLNFQELREPPVTVSFVLPRYVLAAFPEDREKIVEGRGYDTWRRVEDTAVRTDIPAYLPTCLPAYLPTCPPAHLPPCMHEVFRDIAVYFYAAGARYKVRCHLFAVPCKASELVSRCDCF